MNEDISMNDEIEYVPGKCNIGTREIRRRQLIGGIGVFLTISTVFGFYHQHSSRMARFGVFLPALIMSIGYLEARKKFCLAFGFSGLFNFRNLGQAQNVVSEEDRETDHRAAVKQILQALGLAVLVTALVFLLPPTNK
ncbi:MAG TPA: hypothetical protein VIH79_00780 [Candidatus Nanopelagicaceae bacterium]